MSGAFADRLIERARSLRAPLCVGLDPLPARIPALFGDARSDARAVERFCAEIVALAASRAVAVKPQLGFFEPYGAEGVAVAASLCAEAKARGLLVVLDAKRGDIGSTAEGYARACFGPAPGFDADCVTVNPYLGKDSLEPFFAAAEPDRRGVAVLVRTSNPGARDLQDLQVDGRPLWTHVADMIAPASARLRGGSGWSGLMAVAGATYPEEARRLRALLADSLFLVPGYGAQGAGAREAMAGFVSGPAGLEGGLVSASRSVLYPAGAESAADLDVWRAIIGAAMDAARADLAASATA